METPCVCVPELTLADVSVLPPPLLAVVEYALKGRRLNDNRIAWIEVISDRIGNLISNYIVMGEKSILNDPNYLNLKHKGHPFWYP